ncbi:MAG: phenylacetate--CoA ligase family protein [Planctomycetota bacterium]|nr:MAG: phenylacetate--CoA ligase family protein [Planctomycetota bacterium]
MPVPAEPSTPEFPENWPRERIARHQAERLQSLLRHVAEHNPFWQRRFYQAGLDPNDIRTPKDLQRLPTLTKADLVDDQQAHPPYGSNRTVGARFVRLHQTSGTTTGRPLRWLDSARNWDWFMHCWAQIYRVAGVRDDDRLCFAFSFGPFIGFWAAFEAATRLGRFSLAAGGLSSAGRLQLIEDNRVTVVCCTPTYALRLADVAAEMGFDLRGSTVRALIVAGEPGASLPSVRRRIEDAWAARLFDHWGMTEIGSLAIECAENPGGMHLLETECIAEVLDPQSLQPVTDGVGELVVTNLGRIDAPLIRYRTGDLVRIDRRPCPCGRSLLRLDGGILGRADDMLIIRGNNVFPATFEALLREIPEVAEFRIDVDTTGRMPQVTVTVEPHAAGDGGSPQPPPPHPLAHRVREHIKARLNFYVEVRVVPPGTLPRFEMKGRRFFRTPSED